MTNRIKWVLGALLFVLPFVFTATYAGEKRISMTWEGIVIDAGVNVVVEDPPVPDFDANYIDARIRGSFGPGSLGVFSEFTFAGFCDAAETVAYVVFAYSRPVITFKNGDQLWGEFTSGDACLDPASGEFYGSGQGTFTDGTGRFAGADGTFTVDFGGNNLTIATLGVGFGPIYGEIDGTIILP